MRKLALIVLLLAAMRLSAQLVTGGQYNTTPPAPANKAVVATQADSAGNTLISLGFAATTGTVVNSTNGTLNATFAIATNSGAPSVLVSLNDNGGTFTTGQINFQVTYDGTNWANLPAGFVVDPTSTTFATIALPYTLAASTNKAFLVFMGGGARGLRLIFSTALTGTGTVTPYYSTLAYFPVTPAIIQNTIAQNIAQVNGSTVATTATGVQQVGIYPGGNPCLNPDSTLTPVYVSATSGTAETAIVAVSGSTKVYVCSLSVLGTSGTTPTFALTYGTGTACAAGVGNIVFPFSTTSTTVPTTWNGPLVGVTPASNGLCYLQTGTLPIAKFILTYIQQ
jgi:hypothetical protein